MKLESQLTCLELSKELEKLGYPQDSVWYWYRRVRPYSGDGNVLCYNEWFIGSKGEGSIDNTQVYSAPTVAELGERLNYIKGEAWRSEFSCVGKTHLEIEVTKDMFWHRVTPICADTEANARAKMWIYLRKNKLVDVKNL